MPASLAPLSPELFADFKGGKETALEQVFRANFEAFTKEANERLDDVAAAQKCAASAFLDLWDRRAKLESPDHLASLLHQAVTGEATHEQRRRSAAHHMGGNGAPAHEATHAAPETTDQWWAKVQGVLKQAPSDQEAAARQRAEHSRHEAAAHMKKVAQPRRTGLYVVVILLLALAAGAPLWYFSKGAESTKAGQLLNRDDVHVAHTKDGQRGPMTLEDSTFVRMGASTTVKYTRSFPLDARAIQLVGVAAIKAPKGNSPLLTKIGGAWVYASEAEFVARSFPEDSGSVLLKTLEGSVTVKFGKEEKAVNAGSTLLVLANGTFMDLPEDRAKLAFDWLSGNFVSENQPLRKVLAEIKKWYGLDIVPKDSSFLDRPVSMTASLDSAKLAIKALEEGGAVKVTMVSDGRATLANNTAGAKPAKKRR